MNSRLQWKWFGSLALFLAILLFAINVGIDYFFAPYLMDKIQAELIRDIQLTRHLFAGKVLHPNKSEIHSLAQQFSQQTGLRITIIGLDGTVLGESSKPFDEIDSIDNHLDREEVQSAFHQDVGLATRHSATTNQEMLYVASLLKENNQPVGIVRIAIPLKEIDQTIQKAHQITAMATVFAGLITIPLLFWMARSASRPIEEMRSMAVEVANGNLSARTTLTQWREFQELGRALNTMASQLELRLKELQGERTELQAMLSQMIEGVLLVDPKGKIRMINRALNKQFNLSESVTGKTPVEVFRNASLQDFVSRSLKGEPLIEQELTFHGAQEKIFAVNTASLTASDRTVLGAVVVFHDITHLKQLENIRKEFVANVSHELRTPLSIIKGYIETLLENPPDAKMTRQFLTTIHKHSERLESLIHDLLTISSLESKQSALHQDQISIRNAAQNAIEELSRLSQDKNITILNEIPSQFKLPADPLRIHQVFLNLLDNAIKYTNPSCQVKVSANIQDKETIFCVSDNGPGIPPEHVPHLFERFYRVDKARSREQGGTGLGLSIVKHIIQAHGGRVWAESQMGKGSSFFFTLPSA